MPENLSRLLLSSYFSPPCFLCEQCHPTTIYREQARAAQSYEPGETIPALRS
jgi:hypothetical protein